MLGTDGGRQAFQGVRLQHQTRDIPSVEIGLQLGDNVGLFFRKTLQQAFEKLGIATQSGNCCCAVENIVFLVDPL